MGYTKPLVPFGACCSGCARGAPCGTLGATSAAPDPTEILRAQVNRFMGPGAPSKFRLRPTPVPPTGPVDMEVAIHAVVIVQKRAAEAYEKDPNNQDPSFFSNLKFSSTKELLDWANSGFADPVGFVNKNLDKVIQTISIYGDMNNVPKAALSPSGGGKAFGLPTPVIIGIVAIGAFLLLKRK